MILREYCDNMEKQLAAWKSNVNAMLTIAQNLPGKNREADEKQKQELESLISDLGRVTDLLRKECMPA